MKNKIKKIIAEIVEVDLTKIEDDFSQKKCENWDSLNHLNIVIALEKNFNVSFEPEEIAKMLSLEEIYNTINNKI